MTVCKSICIRLQLNGRGHASLLSFLLSSSHPLQGKTALLGKEPVSTPPPSTAVKRCPYNRNKELLAASRYCAWLHFEEVFRLLNIIKSYTASKLTLQVTHLYSWIEDPKSLSCLFLHRKFMQNQFRTEIRKFKNTTFNHFSSATAFLGGLWCEILFICVYIYRYIEYCVRAYG